MFTASQAFFFSPLIQIVSAVWLLQHIHQLTRGLHAADGDLETQVLHGSERESQFYPGPYLMSQQLLFISIPLLLDHLSATLTSLQPHLVKCPAVHLDLSLSSLSNNIKAIYRKKNLCTCLVVLGVRARVRVIACVRVMCLREPVIPENGWLHLLICTFTLSPISHPATVSRAC